MTDKSVIYLSSNGYKISSLFGRILFNGKSFNHLRDAVDFCVDENLDYFIA